MTKIPGNVLRGAAFLDEHLPGWDKKIKLDMLDLGNSCNCVLGQQSCARVTYKRYGIVSKRLGIKPWGRESSRLGFTTWGRQSYSQLTAGWKALIAGRRTA